MKRTISIFLFYILETHLLAQVFAGNCGNGLPATDALKRKLPTYEAAGDPRENRFVGLFYRTWHTDGNADLSTVPNSDVAHINCPGVDIVALNVGFEPYAPVVVSFRATTAPRFRLVIKNASPDSGLTEVYWLMPHGWNVTVKRPWPKCPLPHCPLGTTTGGSNSQKLTITQGAYLQPD